MFKLVISDDEGKTTTVPLVRDEVTIGRKEGNTIRLTDRNVSRRHARLQKQNGHYLLHDLGSYNGVVMNGARLLDAQSVKSGDQIMIGDYKLAILEEAAAQAQAAAPPAHDAMDSVATSVVAVPQVAPPPYQPPPEGLPPSSNGPTASASSEPIPSEVRQMRLVFLAPAGAPAPVTLDRLPLILGRSEVADIALPYSSISREHARLSVQGGLLIIEDLGSSNGVMVNGERQSHAVVGPGDMVTLGVVEFRIAQRGDQTVIFDRSNKQGLTGGVPNPSSPAPANKRSPLVLILIAVGVLAVLGGVAFVLKGSGSPTSAQGATAPQVAPAGVSPAGGIPPTTALPAPTTPTPAVGVEPSPVLPLAVAPAPIVAAAAVPVAAVQPPPAAVDPPPSPTEADPVAPAAVHNTTHAIAAAAPPPVHEHRHVAAAPQPAPAPPVAPTPVHNTTVAAPSPPAHATGDAMTEARNCRGDNQCVITALQTHAQTEQELGLLAVTYRLTGNHAQATRTMQRYLQRFPSGPRAAGFHELLDNQ